LWRKATFPSELNGCKCDRRSMLSNTQGVPAPPPILPKSSDIPKFGRGWGQMLSHSIVKKSSSYHPLGFSHLFSLVFLDLPSSSQTLGFGELSSSRSQSQNVTSWEKSPSWLPYHSHLFHSGDLLHTCWFTCCLASQ
jgi:hypothetical protein